MATDYARLFAEQFGSALGSSNNALMHSTGTSDENEDGRPQTDSTISEQEDVDRLRLAIRKEAKELATWKKPANLGALSYQFEDLMAGQGEQLPKVNSKGKIAY